MLSQCNQYFPLNTISEWVSYESYTDVCFFRVKILSSPPLAQNLHFNLYLSREGVSEHTMTHAHLPSPKFSSFNLSLPLTQFVVLNVCRLCFCVLASSGWLSQDVHSEEEEIHSSDEEDNSSTSSKEHLDKTVRIH